MPSDPAVRAERTTGSGGDPAGEAYLAGHPLALAVFERVRAVLVAAGGCETLVSKSQVAFRRRRAFAYLWPTRAR